MQVHAVEANGSTSSPAESWGRRADGREVQPFIKLPRSAIPAPFTRRDRLSAGSENSTRVASLLPS